MSLADRVLTDSDDRLIPPTNPFLGTDWIDGYVKGLTEAKKPKDKEPQEPDPKDVEPKGKKPSKPKSSADTKDLSKEIEAGAKAKEDAAKKREQKAKAPPKKAPEKEAPAASEPAPDDPNTQAGDKPEPEPEDDDPGGATDAPGASATEPVGAARTPEDCERDHATAIGQADQHARAEQSSRSEADKHRKAVEQYADDYEDAGGQVSQVNGQRHLHPPTAEDSPEIHDIYQQFDDALWNRDEHEMKAIESHRKKRESRGEARRHDYEKQTGEKWTEKDDPPGFGHHHVEPKGGKDKKKPKKPKKDDKKPKTESLNEALDSLSLGF